MRLNWSVDFARIVLASDLGLAMCEDCFHLHGVLPLAGSHLSQLGLIFGVASVAKEILEFLRRY